MQVALLLPSHNCKNHQNEILLSVYFLNFPICRFKRKSEEDNLSTLQETNGPPPKCPLFGCFTVLWDLATVLPSVPMFHP